ncbi:GNAT family N-acetyltransferase [Halomonas sp. CS7]|uniref:GNAT family N-acetyltransferase n=1 Tax=Halomonas pelophila TaxID=3151122 RepID=A0ABV1N6P4_9GAMM
MKVIDTVRLTLRHFEVDDADFIVRLLNAPTFIRHIADKGRRTREEALRYLEHGPMASYRAHGVGRNLVERKGEGTPIGMCGLVTRDELAVTLPECALPSSAQPAGLRRDGDGGALRGVQHPLRISPLAQAPQERGARARLSSSGAL